MEILMKETISFAEITPYLNHCPIDVKVKKDTADMVPFPVSKIKTDYYFVNPEHPSNRRVNIALFRDPKYVRKLRNTEIDFLDIKNTTTNTWSGVFFTENEDLIKKYYGDPFTSISIRTITFSVVRDGDDISIKYSKKIRIRGVNKRYFKIKNIIFGIKFNTKNGNITSYNINFKNSIKNKLFTVRTNWFEHVSAVIHQFNGLRYSFHGTNNIKDIDLRTDEETRIYHALKEKLCSEKFMTKFLDEIDVSDCTITPFENQTITQQTLSKLIEKMVKIKEIKVPDDWYHFLFCHYPGSKYLKRNNNKLVLAVLDSYGLKTKSLVKIIHKYPKISLSTLSELAKLFGPKYPSYLGNIKDEVYSSWGNSKNNGNQSITITQVPLELRKGTSGVFERFVITDDERENIFKLINDTSAIRQNVVSLLLDHISMLNTCKEYYPEISFTSSNWNSFNNEHMRLSKIVKKIKSGMTIEYVYDNRLIRDIERHIGDIKPYILKTDEDYSEEGEYMHHCVATYTSKEQSIIVSLRDGKERVTCEFVKKNGEMVQARYFSNQQPPNNFLGAIESVGQKIKKHSKSRLLEHLEMRKVPVKINGIEVPRKPEPLDLDFF